MANSKYHIAYGRCQIAYSGSDSENCIINVHNFVIPARADPILDRVGITEFLLKFIP